MSVNKKLCLVGVALMLLLAGVFAWHKGLPPFEGRLKPVVEQSAEVNSEQAEAGQAEAGQAEAGGQLPLPSEQPLEQKSAEGAEATAGTQAKSVPAESATADEEGAAPGEAVVRGTVEKGDTVIKMLGSADSQAAQEYIDAAKRVFSMRAFRDGQPYVVVTDTVTGKVKRFEYEIDSRRRLVV